ncbi:MAG: CDP-alcohol phosphatidyltransferase family protein [Candidatus Geothermarchaeales archaeon]
MRPLVLERFRTDFLALLEGIAKRLAPMGITATHMTVLALALSVVSGMLLWAKPTDAMSLLAAVTLFAASSTMDAIDGTLARLQGEETRFGAFVDSYVDRIAEIVLVSGLMLGGYSNLLAGVLFLSTSLLISYARARAEALAVDMAGIGLMERAERLILLIIGMLMWSLDSRSLDIILLAGSLLNVVTVLQRSYHVWRVLGSEA